MDIKEEIDRNTAIHGDFNTSLTSMDRSSRQKINKETAALYDTLDQMDLIDVFRAFHPKAREQTYFSGSHGTYSNIDHMLRQEKQVSINLRRLKSYSSIFSDYNAMKLEINNKNTEKHAKTWKLNNMLLNNEWVNNKIEEEIQIP